MAFAIFLSSNQIYLRECIEDCFRKADLSWNVFEGPSVGEELETIGCIEVKTFSQCTALAFSNSYSENGNSPNKILSVENIVESLAEDKQIDCLFLTIWEDYLWQYKLFQKGVLSASFQKHTGFTDEPQSPTGNPDRLASMFGVPASQIYPYHIQVATKDDFEDVLLPAPFASDRELPNHLDPNQAFDFAEELGVRLGNSEEMKTWTVYKERDRNGDRSGCPQLLSH